MYEIQEGSVVIPCNVAGLMKKLGVVCPDLKNHVSPEHIFFDKSEQMSLFVLGVSCLLELDGEKWEDLLIPESAGFLEAISRGITSDVCVFYALQNADMVGDIENCVRTLCPTFHLPHHNLVSV